MTRKKIEDTPDLWHKASAQVSIFYRKVEDLATSNPGNQNTLVRDDWTIHIVLPATAKMLKATSPLQAIYELKAGLMEVLGMPEKIADEHAHDWIRNLAGEFAIHGFRRPYVPRDAPDFEYFALSFEKIFSPLEMHAYRKMQKGEPPELPDIFINGRKVRVTATTTATNLSP